MGDKGERLITLGPWEGTKKPEMGQEVRLEMTSNGVNERAKEEEGIKIPLLHSV